MKKGLLGLVIFALVGTSRTASAQQLAAPGTLIVITTAAPVFVMPDATRAPLRVAKEGSVLNLIDTRGDWYQVEFSDPQLGRRAGFVQAKYAKVSAPTLEPADLTVPEAARKLSTPETASQLSVPTAPTAVPSVHRASLNAPGARERSTLYITPTEDHFEVYLSAAMAKKGVPLTVTNSVERASLVLRASVVDVQKQSTGSKFARCIFAYCAGIEDRGATSVQLLDGDTIVWSYSVNKGRGQKNRQSLAEAIAKHLKEEYLDVR